MKETQMPPAHAANLAANSDNAIYRIERIEWTVKVIIELDNVALQSIHNWMNGGVHFTLIPWPHNALCNF